MAFLKDLIVNGSARFLNAIHTNGVKMTQGTDYGSTPPPNPTKGQMYMKTSQYAGKVFECKGIIGDNASNDSFKAVGTALVHCLPNGVAIIYYGIQFYGTPSGDLMDWGLNAKLLQNVCPGLPKITPQNGGTLNYITQSGVIWSQRQNYSGTHETYEESLDSNFKHLYWHPSRVHTAQGAVGQWGQVNCADVRLEGICYGTYEG